MPPTSSLSLEYFSRLPISPSNPALLLCARGPHAWDTRSYIPQAALEYSLSSTLRDLARTATPNLRSLMDALQCQQHARQHDTESLPSDQNGAAHNETALPEWALHIGLIYDSQEIRCVAHIPYSPPSDTYLSLHFATLPLPPNCSDTGDLKEFIEGRYRVAVALLSLQHHIARLAKLYQEASWAAWDQPYSPEPAAAFGPSAKWSLALKGLRCTSPTISEIASDMDKSLDLEQTSSAYAEIMYGQLASSGSYAGPDSELVLRICDWYDACAADGCEGCETPTDSVLAALDGQPTDLHAGCQPSDVRLEFGLHTTDGEDDNPEDSDDQSQGDQPDHNHSDDRKDAELDSSDSSLKALTDNDSDSDYASSSEDSCVSVQHLRHQWKEHVLNKLQPEHW